MIVYHMSETLNDSFSLPLYEIWKCDYNYHYTAF